MLRLNAGIKQGVILHEFDKQRAPRFGFNTHGNVIPVPVLGNKRNVTIIAAMDAKGGIGKKGGMPWNVSPDMQQFKRLTSGQPVIMGRKTFESLKRKPLPDRVNIVLASDVSTVYDHADYPNLVAVSDLGMAVEFNDDEQIFIIGGGRIYESALINNLVDDMILTRFNNDAQCDVFFPDFNRGNWLDPVFSTHKLGGGVTMRYEYWQRRKEEE